MRFRTLKANLDPLTTYRMTNRTCLSLIKGNNDPGSKDKRQ